MPTATYMGTIEIVNRTSKIRDERWLYALPCLAHTMTEHFAPKWGVVYSLAFVGASQTPTHGTNPKLWLVDRAGMPGALGFHNIGMDGQPYGMVGVLDDQEDGVDITATIDHELKELAADPDTNRIVGPDYLGRYYAVEVCDPVEADIDGPLVTVGQSTVRCSNFVCPRYYGLPNFDGTPDLDFMGKLKAGVPALLDGGYQSYYDTADPGWHTVQRRLISGHTSTRSRHTDGRSTMRAGLSLGQMMAEASDIVPASMRP